MPFQRGGDGEKDWLEGCVPWNGKEKYLPTGALLPTKVNVLRLVKSWDVLRGDEVKRGVKTAAIQADDIIVSATPNNAAIRAVLNTYGEDQFLFTDANGRQLKPKAWVRKYKTNPFVVLAIMRKSRGIT